MINKRGMFFTIAIIFALTILVLLAFQYRTILTKPSLKVRISTMNDFVASAERDIERATYISGFRTILAMEQYLLNGNTIEAAEVEASFKEALFNGTLNQTLGYLQNPGFQNGLIFHLDIHGQT